jgi:hypothetical protein
VANRPISFANQEPRIGGCVGWGLIQVNRTFPVSEQDANKESAQLADVSDELRRSLRLCHSLVDDYRLKLAANSNERDAANEDEEDQSGLG